MGYQSLEMTLARSQPGLGLRPHLKRVDTRIVNSADTVAMTNIMAAGISRPHPNGLGGKGMRAFNMPATDIHAGAHLV
jgi:hypothetical protein